MVFLAFSRPRVPFPLGSILASFWRILHIFGTFLQFVLRAFFDASLYFQGHTGFVRIIFNIFFNSLRACVTFPVFSQDSGIGFPLLDQASFLT